MRRAAKKRNNKTTPRNTTNTKRRHIEQITLLNSKQESYCSKKDFYGKVRSGQETVSMLCNKSVCNFRDLVIEVQIETSSKFPAIADCFLCLIY